MQCNLVFAGDAKYSSVNKRRRLTLSHATWPSAKRSRTGVEDTTRMKRNGL